MLSLRDDGVTPARGGSGGGFESEGKSWQPATQPQRDKKRGCMKKQMGQQKPCGAEEIKAPLVNAETQEVTGWRRARTFLRSGYQRWEGGWVWWQTNHSSCQILTDIPSLVRSAHAAFRLSPVLPYFPTQSPPRPQSTEETSPRLLPSEDPHPCFFLGAPVPDTGRSPHHSPPSVSMSPNFFLPWVFLFFKHSELLWSHYVLEWKYNFTERRQFNFPWFLFAKAGGGMPFTSAGQQNLLWCWKGPLSALSNTAAPGGGWVMGTWNVV